MAKTITLKKLLDIAPLSSNDGQMSKMKNLLGDLWSILTKNVKGDKPSDGLVSGLWTGNAAYRGCAEFLSDEDNLNKAFNNILNRWNEAPKLRKDKAQIIKLIDGDEENDKLGEELLRRLKSALELDDAEILNKALTVLTLLSITRSHWSNISDKIVKLMPSLSTLPGNPSSEVADAFERCRECYGAFGADAPLELERAKISLTQALDRDTADRWKGYVLSKLGELWFGFVDKNFHVTKRSALNTHIVELYSKKILSAPERSRRLIAQLSEFDSEISRVNRGADVSDVMRKERSDQWFALSKALAVETALNFFRAARTHLDADDWQRVSDKYLSRLLSLFKGGNSECVTDFITESNAAMSEAKKSWYGSALYKLVEAAQERNDTTDFENCLNRAVELGNVEAKYLLMTILLTPKEDRSEFYSMLDDRDAWSIKNPYELAESLTHSTIPHICGGACYSLYLRDAQKKPNRQLLRRAWQCGYPKEAVREFEDKIVSYCEELEHADYRGAGVCLLNVDEDNQLGKIFSSTAPEHWKMHHVTNGFTKKTVGNVLDGERLICLLLDDADKNLADFLRLMELLKNASTMTTVIVRGDTDILTPVIDSALTRVYRDDEQRTFIRVRILDDDLISAESLLMRHPLFYPVRDKTSSEKVTLHFAVIGDGALALHLVREAYGLTCFHESLNVEVKLTLLSPFGRSLTAELRSTCPEIPSKAIRERHILLPGFSAPDSDKIEEKTLEAFIDEVKGEALYFASALSTDPALNLNIAIRLRETLVRSWLRHSSDKVPPSTPIALYVPDPDVAFIAKRTVILGEEYSGSPAWFNSYAPFIPFGSRLKYTWENLIRDETARRALAVHMVYCGATDDDGFRLNYCSYARRVYNSRSSLAVVHGLPYRLWHAEKIFDQRILDGWDISDEKFFSDVNLNALAKKTAFLDDKAEDELEELFRFEHKRWRQWMISQGWIAASDEDVEKFFVGGNRRQQLFIAKAHSCMRDWSRLDSLSDKLNRLSQNVGIKKVFDFKSSDKTSISATYDILNETLLSKSATFKALFCAD